MTSLATGIVRLLPDEPGFTYAGADLAERITRCGEDLPPGTRLILGGSLARGEPSIVVRADRYDLISDIDFLLVHDGVLPPFSTAEFVRQHVQRLPTVTLMSLSAGEYARLGTSLGYDFKDGGIPIGTAGMPPYAEVTVTARDALEVFAFSIFMYFFDELGDRWIAGESGDELHFAHSRVCSKVLRSVGMLHGMHSQHQTADLPGPLGDRARQELTWLRSADKAKPLPPGRVWSLLALALREHDRVAGGSVRDAIHGSVYQGRPGADFIAAHQAIALDLLRGILDRYDPAGADPAEFARAKQGAWTALVERGQARPFVSPESFFSVRAASIRDQLLLMKI